MLFTLKNALRVTELINGEVKEAPFAKDILMPHNKHDDISSTGFSKVSFDEMSGMLDISYNGKELNIKIHRNKCAIKLFTKPDEGFYGFGEWFNGFRRTEGRLTIHNQESPAFLQHKQTYSAFPCFLSDYNYMIFILNAHKANVNIKKNKSLSIDFSSGNLDFFIITGDNFKEIIGTYTSLTGKPPLLPLWTFGLWNTAYPVENQEQTLARITSHRDKKMPLDAVIFDYHWQEGFSNFKWRKTVFPDPVKMLEEMRCQGIKAGLIYTPYINRESFPIYKFLVRLYVKNAPDGVPILSGDYASEEYHEGVKKGFFAHDNVTWWLGKGGAVDFTNEKACEWWFDKQIPLLDQGIYFFKNDGAEYLPKGSKSSTGLDDEEYHNLYCFYYTKALFERLQKYHCSKRALVFSRTNWAGTQRYPGIFLGDQTPEFKHIAATMRCGLNMSLLGYAYWGADVLSLYKKPSEELHLRYSQWSIFSPISRYFSNPDDPNRNPWGISKKCEDSFRRHINLKMKLLPHYYRLARESYDTGIPIIRPLYMEFPDDPHTRTIWQQAMIGDNMMIAPVLEPGAKSIKVYFPEGSWFSWWDDSRYEGPAWSDICVDEGHLPIFLYAAKPLILGKALQCIPENHRFDELEIHFFHPFESTAILYEDDCSSISYQSGEFSFQKFIFKEYHDADISITSEAAEGRFDGRPLFRKVAFNIHSFRSSSYKAVSGECTIENVVYDEVSNILTITAQINNDKTSVIRITE